jgi:hypothetical protein
LGDGQNKPDRLDHKGSGLDDFKKKETMKNNCKLFKSTMFLAVGLATIASAQDRDGDRDGDHHEDRHRVARIEPGTTIAIRTNQFIDSDRRDSRVYSGTVSQDVRGEHGRLAIPRGSQVELIVRVAHDNDLILDLESVTVAGQRYGLQTDVNRVEGAREDNSLVGAIVGAINGGQASGREVKIRQGTVLTFRLQRPLAIGVADRGETRDGEHYHDYDHQH